MLAIAMVLSPITCMLLVPWWMPKLYETADRFWARDGAGADVSTSRKAAR